VYFSSKQVGVAGTGSYTPEKRVTNEELAEKLGSSADWIVENLGIRERRVAAEGEMTSHLARKAADRALESAGISPSEIDLLIVATATPDRKAPSTACLVHRHLGLKQSAPSFDLAAVCSGFIYAQTVAAQAIECGNVRHALVIGADRFSSITDWNRRDCVFFGDGAGAVVLRKSEGPPALFASELFSDGSGHDGFTVFPGDPYFSMNGKAVYETATQVLPNAILGLLRRNGLGIEDVSWIIPHQPAIKVLQKTADILGFPFERVLTNMDRYANTSGGTVPILLDEANRSGKLKSGDLIVSAAVGSGWTWGALLFRWP